MKTKKLELKHLAAYLPYKLQVTNKIDNGTTYIGEKPPYYYTVRGIKYATEDVIFIDLIINDNKHYSTSHIDYLMPILRPLSDLTKENIKELAEIGIKGHPNSLIKRAIEDIEYRVKTNNTTKLPYVIIEKLIEWHFDIFGLIKLDLAIDINTLTQQK